MQIIGLQCICIKSDNIAVASFNKETNDASFDVTSLTYYLKIKTWLKNLIGMSYIYLFRSKLNAVYFLDSPKFVLKFKTNIM